MDFSEFIQSLWGIINQMSGYLLLGFLIAGILHVFVPNTFYHKYLSKDNKFAVLWAALLGIPLPLCSCGVIPTAVGLKNENASKGAVASFLIATPQTGIDSILATFSLMGLGFAVIRPVAALITGICGGLLVNRYVKDNSVYDGKVRENSFSSVNEKDNNKSESNIFLKKIINVFHYAFVEMLQSIGLRLCVGLILAALINIAVPDEFFLNFADRPLLQMLIILIIAVPMYICSTGSIPIAAALVLKGLSPGAALVMLMAGPAVNLASVLVVHKSLGRKFTFIYLFTVITGAMAFGILINALNISPMIDTTAINGGCCTGNTCCGGTNAHSTSIFSVICSILLLIFIINALSMTLFGRFKKSKIADNSVIFKVEGMNCVHCKAAVEKAALNTNGVETAEANVNKKTLIITGNCDISELERNITEAGFTFKGRI